MFQGTFSRMSVVCSMLSIMFWHANGLTRGRAAKEGEFPYIVRILVSENVGINETGRSLIGNKGHCSDSELDRSQDESSGRVDHYTRTRQSEVGESNICQKNEEVNREGHIDWNKIKQELLKEFSSNNATKIAAGTLITTTRILTTCDTVCVFTGTMKKDFPLYQVLIMAGSIYRSGSKGEFKFPNSSLRHPYCRFFQSNDAVIFNYGIFLVETPFGKESNPRMIAPVTRYYRTRNDMEIAVQNMISGNGKMNCHAFGWGNDEKRFEAIGMPDNFERFSEVLQAAQMEFVSYEECEYTTCHYFKQCLIPLLEYGSFCAKAPRGGPCTEDWASPLVCNGIVFGIHVQQQRCRDVGVPRIFLRVDLAFDFVYGIRNRSQTSIWNSFMLYSAVVALSWYQYFSPS